MAAEGRRKTPRYNRASPIRPRTHADTRRETIPAQQRMPLRFVTAASLFDGHDANQPSYVG